jgi:hypothetical protein
VDEDEEEDVLLWELLELDEDELIEETELELELEKDETDEETELELEEDETDEETELELDEDACDEEEELVAEMTTVRLSELLPYAFVHVSVYVLLFRASTTKLLGEVLDVARLLPFPTFTGVPTMAQLVALVEPHSRETRVVPAGTVTTGPGEMVPMNAPADIVTFVGAAFSP